MESPDMLSLHVKQLGNLTKQPGAHLPHKINKTPYLSRKQFRPVILAFIVVLCIMVTLLISVI